MLHPFLASFRGRYKNVAEAAKRIVSGEIILLSRDLIATLDLEPYHQIENTNVPREDLESSLREMALFDALFTLRQWPPSDISVILREFFGDTREEWMKTRLGWNVADAVEVYTALNRSQPGDPIQISHTKLLSEKVTAEVLNALVPNLAHPSGAVNASYVSPVGAKSNLMMKPLIEMDIGRFIVVSKSPVRSFYEAIVAVLRDRRPSARTGVAPR